MRKAKTAPARGVAGRMKPSSHKRQVNHKRERDISAEKYGHSYHWLHRLESDAVAKRIATTTTANYQPSTSDKRVIDREAFDRAAKAERRAIG